MAIHALSDMVIGATSVVAPLRAGLIARINAGAGSPAGYINPKLYNNAVDLSDIAKGNNGDFFASAGWDACTGPERPAGQKLVTATG